MLRVSELRERKHALEQEIALLVQAFEKDTGVEVDGLITLNRQELPLLKESKHTLLLVEVHLNM